MPMHVRIFTYYKHVYLDCGVYTGLFCGKRDLYMRPGLWGIHTHAWPAYLTKEAYTCDKRDLYIWQNRHTNLAQDLCRVPALNSHMKLFSPILGIFPANSHDLTKHQISLQFSEFCYTSNSLLCWRTCVSNISILNINLYKSDTVTDHWS